MANQIIWSDRALNEYEALLVYLYSEWGDAITSRVVLEINQQIARIQKSPEHFPVFLKKKKIQRCVASPQTSVFFKVNNGEIIIISVFDNRQNPQKRKL